MGLKLIHAADLHLGGPVAAPDPALADLAAGARREALGRLVDLARREGAAAILLAGDVFDHPQPPISAQAALEEACGQCRAAGIQVFISPGNHDPWIGGSVWETWAPPENVVVFTPTPAGRPLGDSGLWVAGAGHDSDHVERDLAAALPAPPDGAPGLACLHADLPGARDKSLHLPYAPTRLEVLTGGPFLYWALGHWHQSQVLADRPRVVMAGTPQGAHLGETGPKGAWVVEIDPPAVRARLAPLAPLAFADLAYAELGEVATPSDLARRVAADLGREALGGAAIALRLALAGPSPLWRQLTAPEAREELKGVLGVEGLILDAGRLGPPVDRAELSRRDDVLGRLLQLMDRLDAEPELARDLARDLGPLLHPLLASGDETTRSETLRALLERARALAVRDLWQGGPGA